MKIIYVVNGLGFSLGMPIGGADKRVVEIGRNLIQSGDGVLVLTTDEGEEVLRRWGLSAEFYTVARPSFWPKRLENSLLGRMAAYIYTIVLEFYLILRLKKADYQLIYSSSDMFFDLIPSLFLRLKRSEAKLVGIVHHWIPGIRQRRGPLIVNLFVLASQKLGFFVLRTFYDLIFVPENREGERLVGELQKLLKKGAKLAFFRNGVNLQEIEATVSPPKKYDACFLGSLRPSKGIFDLVEIWAKVLEKRPQATLVVIGGGLTENRHRLINKISQKGLGSNISLVGVLPQTELYRYLKSCRVFISPSHEEGWGIALVEALSCGLPAVVYDLPSYGSLREFIEIAALGDIGSFADKVVELLVDESQVRDKARLVIPSLSAFDWSKIAGIERDQLLGLLEGKFG